MKNIYFSAKVCHNDENSLKSAKSSKSAKKGQKVPKSAILGVFRVGPMNHGGNGENPILGHFSP